MKVLVFLFVLLAFLPGLAAANCNFAPGYQVAPEPSRLGQDFSMTSSRPAIHLAALQRAKPLPPPQNGLLFIEPCYEAAQMVLVLSVPPGPLVAGYFFSLEQHRKPFEQNSEPLVEQAESSNLLAEAFPAYLVQPVQLADGQAGFVFYWNDRPDLQQALAPLEATLAVRQVLSNGFESEATLINISHPGE